jgi:hypothetical protein
MLVVPFINWKECKIPLRIFMIGLFSGIIFLIVFFGVRMYYGYQSPEGINGMYTFTDYFFFNIRFLRMYPELIGTLAIIPFVVLIYLKRLPPLLIQWFWVICPVWFLIHLSYSTAVESRLFLVPQCLVFIPGFLVLVEQWYEPSKEYTE